MCDVVFLSSASLLYAEDKKHDITHVMTPGLSLSVRPETETIGQGCAGWSKVCVEKSVTVVFLSTAHLADPRPHKETTGGGRNEESVQEANCESKRRHKTRQTERSPHFVSYIIMVSTISHNFHWVLRHHTCFAAF